MNTNELYVGAFCATVLAWCAIVGWTLCNRLLYDRMMRQLMRCVGEPGRHGVVPDKMQVEYAVRTASRAVPRGALGRLVLDPDQPEWLRNCLAAVLLERYGVRRMTRDAARRSWLASRWRRIVAWHVLYRTQSTDLHWMLRKALGEGDRVLASAAVVILGAMRDRGAAAILVEALRSGSCSPACIAMQLEKFNMSISVELLYPLLDDPRPVLRFWAVSLLAQHHGIIGLDERLGAHAADVDASVRKAVAQAMGEIGTSRAIAVVIGLLGDSSGFVRAHAIRSLLSIGRSRGDILIERLVAPMKGDHDWWVRLAVRETLAARTGAPHTRAAHSDVDGAGGRRADEDMAMPRTVGKIAVREAR